MLKTHYEYTVEDVLTNFSKLVMFEYGYGWFRNPVFFH